MDPGDEATSEKSEAEWFGHSCRDSTIRDKLQRVRVRFRGVRGSVPFATAGSIGHGCNTACLELTDESSGRRLILDAGSGIVGMGKDLEMPIPDVPIILTHYHWDHVQGLPFFAPFYRPGTVSTVWAPSLGPQRVDIETMFAAPFFPVALRRFPCASRHSQHRGR